MKLVVPRVRRYNTRHEFGHAIGLGHEHQSPLCTIKRVPQQQIYSYHSSLCKWSTEKIEKEIIRRYSLSEVRVTLYDERSVMHYPIYLTRLYGAELRLEVIWSRLKESDLIEFD